MQAHITHSTHANMCWRREDTKCSYHATVHIMEPASRHKTVITRVMDMVKRDRPSAYRAMVEKDGLKRGIESPGR